jgi:hypothetical protein
MDGSLAGIVFILSIMLYHRPDCRARKIKWEMRAWG